MPISKQSILEEIKRTAESNGGTPLGRLKFATETGIKESDWKKHWVRWNDAVREAGLAPNEQTVAYDDDFLIEQYVELIRELGHFPVSAELRMKARTSEFPSEKTLSRLGAKPQLAEKIAEYCAKRNGYEDVIAICSVLMEGGLQAPEESATFDDAIGFVYMLKSGKFYKVGRSKSFDRRERELAIQLPQRADTVHVIRTDDPVGIEAYWHKRFEAKRKNGEWFELSAVDVKAFKRRKFM
ncbi:MAG: GIY-YIG nuclease family protein [Magnetospirillum sp.]|nr:GIY-YIG nuclease family protein [Magnetospirillum sp.]